MNAADQTNAKNNAQSRRNFPRIKVSCSPEEKVVIEANAKKANLSVSSFLRLLGLGCEPRAAVDLEAIKDLVRVRGDLNRAGGLLKLWLSKESVREKFGTEHVRALLGKIEKNSEGISLLLQEIRRKHSKPRKGEV